MTDFRNPQTGEVRFLSKPLMNDYKGLITASYQTPLRKWQFDVTAQLNGGGRMPTPATDNPLWEERFDPFSVYNVQITKYTLEQKTYSISDKKIPLLMLQTHAVPILMLP